MTENHGNCGPHVHVQRAGDESVFDVTEFRDVIKEQIGGHEAVSKLSTDDLIDVTLEFAWAMFLSAVDASIREEQK